MIINWFKSNEMNWTEKVFTDKIHVKVFFWKNFKSKKIYNILINKVKKIHNILKNEVFMIMWQSNLELKLQSEIFFCHLLK